MDLILIHGALGARSQLEPLIPLLGDGVRAHTIELEGHGATPSPGPYDMRCFVANVRDYMDAKRIERASLFGYSMGGYVALMLAAESPERVASVATLATKLAWTPDVAAKEKKQLDAASIQAKIPAFAEMLRQRHAGAGGWELVLERTAALMTELGRQPLVDAALLSRMRQRALLMVGENDVVVSVDETSAAAAMLSNGKHLVLHATPHPFERTRPELVADPLVSFFAGKQ